MIDYALEDRQVFLKSIQPERTPAQRYARLMAKRDQAVEWMGTKWVLHPANQVKKLSEPLPEVFAWKPSKILKRGRK